MTGKDTFPVEVRRVETEVYETGAGGNRVDVTYELGAVIDGKWARFASVSQGAVDALQAPDDGKAKGEPAPTAG